MTIQVNSTDVEIKKLEIRGAAGRYDLNPHIQELSIYENIFRPALTAKVVLSDSHNIPYKLPIVGEETVDIDISLTGFGDSNDSEVFSIKPPPFHVNSISARTMEKPKAQRFTLDLISETYMSSVHSKISKSYNNKKISDIVSDIYLTYLSDDKKRLFVQSSEKTECIIIPNLNPLDAIAWLTKRAVPETSSGVNYLYYETINSSYFVSIDSLVSEEPVYTFFQRPRVDDPTAVENVTAGIFKINNFQFIKQFDKIENTQRGVYASKLLTHDIVKKKITQYEYGGFNNWFSINHCGQFPPLSNSEVETHSSNVARTTYAPNEEANTSPSVTERYLNNMVDSKVIFYPKHDQMYCKNYGDLYDNKVEDWKLQRYGHIGIYDGINILLEVSGISGLRTGMVVDVLLPSPEVTDKDQKTDVEYDKFLSGKYIVTAIQHIFTKQESNSRVVYNMKIEVSKDGLEDAVSSRLSRKEN